MLQGCVLWILNFFNRPVAIISVSTVYTYGVNSSTVQCIPKSYSNILSQNANNHCCIIPVYNMFLQKTSKLKLKTLKYKFYIKLLERNRNFAEDSKTCVPTRNKLQNHFKHERTDFFAYTHVLLVLWNQLNPKVASYYSTY